MQNALCLMSSKKVLKGKVVLTGNVNRAGLVEGTSGRGNQQLSEALVWRVLSCRSPVVVCFYLKESHTIPHRDTPAESLFRSINLTLRLINILIDFVCRGFVVRLVAGL